MFGYLSADRSLLTPDEDRRYRSAYCGLCRSIRDRYGQLAGATLNYDLCFLILFLQSLYEASENRGEDTCFIHPRKPREWWSSTFTEYAADMNIALSYLKFRDDWEDEGSLPSLIAAEKLKADYKKLMIRYPRQCRTMEQSMSALHCLERTRTEDADAAAEAFAPLMAEVFVIRDDRWADTLRSFGAGLGKVLYIMDAVVDLNRDSVFGGFNPFRRYYGLEDNEKRFRDILNMLLGECLYYFDYLPLVDDVGLLKNILCFGIWSRFDQKYAIGKEKKDGIKSV
jgi:hypothetical protein